MTVLTTDQPQRINPNIERLLTGSIGATLARLAGPNIAGFLVFSGVTVAEIWYVGQIGTQALAGLALAYPMFMLMTMLSAGSIGGAIAAAVARAIGAGKQARSEALSWHALAIGLGAAGVFTVIFLGFGSVIYSVLGGKGQTLADALDYSNVIFAGCAVIWLFNTLGSILRGAGDMKTPAKAMLATALIQVPLGGALCLGWGPFPRLGIAGIAWATLIGMGFATIPLLVKLAARDTVARLHFGAFRLRSDVFGDILKTGLVATLNPFLTVVTVITVTGLVSRFGDAALAGFGIGTRLEFLLIPIVFGVGAALIAMVGANVGAGNHSRALRIGWTGGVSAALATGAIGTVVAIWPQIWVGLYTNDPAVIAMGTAYLTVVGPFYLFFGLGLSLYFASQGAGSVNWPVVAGAGRMLVAAGGGVVAIQWFDVDYDGLLRFVAAGMVVYGIGTALSILLGAWRR